MWLTVLLAFWVAVSAFAVVVSALAVRDAHRNLVEARRRLAEVRELRRQWMAWNATSQSKGVIAWNRRG